MTERLVVLTDEAGNETGLAEILDAHTGEGKLHRAFSVYVFRKNGQEILLQQRSTKKLLFANFWANTCCSHPFPEEDIVQAGERRLQEECGFTLPLHVQGAFVYKAIDPAGNGIEYEHDTLLVGTADSTLPLQPDPAEIAQLEWRNTADVLQNMQSNPELYAPWFLLGLPKLTSL